MRKEKFSGVKKAQDYKKDMLSFETIIMLKIIGDSDDQLFFNGNFVYLFFQQSDLAHMKDGRGRHVNSHRVNQILMSPFPSDRKEKSNRDPSTRKAGRTRGVSPFALD